MTFDICPKNGVVFFRQLPLTLASFAQEKKAKVVKDEKMGQVKHEDDSQWFSLVEQSEKNMFVTFLWIWMIFIRILKSK